MTDPNKGMNEEAEFIESLEVDLTDPHMRDSSGEPNITISQRSLSKLT